MSRSFWVIVFALGLVLFTSLGQAQENADDKDRQADQEQTSTEYMPAPFRVEIVEDQAETIARQSREKDAVDREIADLSAQQEMNAATQKMADLAYLQTWFVGLGTLLLLGTLFFGIGATKAAVDAAKYQRIANRPALTPINPRLVEIRPGGAPAVPPALSLWFDVENVGGGPATLQGYGVGHLIGKGDIDRNSFAAEQELPGRWYIKPDESRDFGAAFHHFELADSPQWEKIQDWHVGLRVFGYLLYVDGFGVARKSGFCFEYGAKDVNECNLDWCGPHSLWYDEEISIKN